MNKFLLFLSLWFTPFAYCNSVDNIVNKSDQGIATVYADGKDAVETIYGDAKSVAPEIASNLKGIAKELKVGVNHVWHVLIRQQLVTSIQILILLFVTIGSWIHFWYRYNQGMANNWTSNKNHNVNDRYHTGEPGVAYELVCVLTVLIAIAGTITTGIFFNTMLTGFINPEFGAMKDIILFTSSLKH